MASRAPNGSGYTYKVGKSYKTVIRCKGLVITATAKTASESKRIAKDKAKRIPAAQLADKSRKRRYNLSTFLPKWLDEQHRPHLAHSTYQRYKGLERIHILPLLGNYYLEELTPRVIAEFLTQLRVLGVGPRSMQQARILLSLALRAAEEQELIIENPVRKVRNPHYRSPQIEPLTLEDVRRMLYTYDGTYMSARLHLALLCGLRQGEALGLQWQDIDWAQNSIQITKQMQTRDGQRVLVPLKTHRSHRTIFLANETVKVLKQHLVLLGELKQNSPKWEDTGLVFPSANGLPISPKTDFKNWHRCLDMCGIQTKRLHDARHTAATLMYSQGVGIETISRALGHSSSAITSKLYVHAAERPLKEMASRMQELLL